MALNSATRKAVRVTNTVDDTSIDYLSIKSAAADLKVDRGSIRLHIDNGTLYRNI